MTEDTTLSPNPMASAKDYLTRSRELLSLKSGLMLITTLDPGLIDLPLTLATMMAMSTVRQAVLLT